MYDNYYQGSSMASASDNPGMPFDMDIPDDAKSAALSVAFVLGMGVAIAVVLKRAGFRAMIAVGRG